MIIFWKLLAELALYFSIITAVPFLFTISFNPVYIILLCLLSVAIGEFAHRKAHSGLRFIGIVPAIVPLLFIRSALDAVIILPAMLYTVLIIITKFKQPNYYNAVKLFKVFCRILVFTALFLLGSDYLLQFITDNAIINGNKAEFKTFNYIALFICDTVFLLSESIMLKKLRVNTPTSLKKSAEGTGRYLTAMVGNGALLGGLIVVFCLILELINKLYLKMSGISLRMPAFVENILFILKKWLFDGVKGNGQFAETGATPTPLPVSGDIPPESAAVTPTPAPVEATADSTWLVIVTIVILLAAVLLFFFLHSRQAVVYKEPESPDEESLRTEHSVNTPGDLSNRSKVRKAYRSFLKYAKKHGFRMQASDTSLDVQSRTSDFVNADCSETLRSIYLQARYNKETEITDDMVREAESALNTILNKQ